MNTETRIRGEKNQKNQRIQDSSPGVEFSDIIELAAYITDSPISLISILEGKQQILKSHRGIDFQDFTFSDSLCKEVVVDPNQLLIIEDVHKKDEYKNIPLLKTLPDIVFYAGIPLVSPSGDILGSLCVLDKESKSLDKKQISALKSLGRQVVQLLELRQTKFEKERQFRELQQESRKVRNLIEATQVGTWEWNVQTNEFDVNDRWAEMLGYTKKELQPITIDTWYKLVAPEDIPFSDKKLNKCLEGELDFYNVECRMKHRNGHYIWVNDRGRVIEWTDDGMALIMTGTHTDITNRKTREIQFNTISNNIPGAVFRYKLQPDGSDELQLVTKGAYKLWGFSAEQIMENNQLIWERFHPDDISDHLKSVKKSADELSFWEHEWRYCHPDGSVR